jgi:excisionase family DNA binding protein
MSKPTTPEPLAVRGTEAARMLGVSLSTIDRLRRAGKLPTAKIDGVRVYPIEGLHSLIRAHEEAGAP